jgi:hypothetical protein
VYPVLPVYLSLFLQCLKYGDLEFVAYVAKNPNQSYENAKSSSTAAAAEGSTERTGDPQQNGVNEVAAS